MSHDRHWLRHPAVRTGDELTLGERMADHMKGILATWTALGGILLIILIWMVTSGAGHDFAPYIGLNLCLSCLAALQCFVLLIAAKRADGISSEVALHTQSNTEDLKTLLAQNTELTRAVESLTRSVHAHVCVEENP